MRLRKIIKHLLPYGVVRFIQTRRSVHPGQQPSPYWRPLERRHDECIILAGGPSAKALWDDLARYARHADVITVNRGLQAPETRTLQPMAHFIVDQAAFVSGFEYRHPHIENCFAELRTMLSLVDWPMSLYVPPHFYTGAVNHGYQTKHVTLAAVPLSSPSEMLPDSEKFHLMNVGVHGAGAQTVVVPALYAAIAARYKRIWIAGLDGDFMHTFFVDKNCRLFMEIAHSNDLTPQRIFFPQPVSWILHTFYTMASQFDFLKKYADYCEVQLINISPTSLLDFAPKGRLGEEPCPWLRGTLPTPMQSYGPSA